MVKPSELKACKKCRYLTTEKKCPICGGETTKEWQGYLVVIDYKRSEIARKMGITINGKYALKVRGEM